MRTPLVTALILAALPATAAPAKRPLPPPTAATQRLILDVAEGRRQLTDLVDPKVGLIYLDDFEGPGDGHWKPTHKLLCGRDLAKRLKALTSELKGRAKDDHQEGHLYCSNKPGEPYCSYGASMEWDPSTVLHFKRRDDGTIFLTAVTIRDVVLVDDSADEANARKQQKWLTKLSAQSCPE